MAAPPRAPLPDGRVSYGIMHAEYRQWALPDWLNFVYRDGIQRHDYPVELAQYKVRRMEEWKQIGAGGWEHEFLCFTYRYTYQGRDFERYLRIERMGQLNQDEDPNTNPGLRELKLAIAKPGTIDSLARTSDVSAALFGTKEAGDLVAHNPYHHSVKAGQIGWPASSELLYALDFPPNPDRQPSILHLALVVDQIHTIGPRYMLLGAMCYWHSRAVYEVLKTKFGGTEVAGKQAALRGKYRGKSYVSDNLRFNISQLTQEVIQSTAAAALRRSSKKEKQSQSSFPVGLSDVSPDAQGLSEQMETERSYVVDRACPEVFTGPQDEPASPLTRTKFIQPIEELIRTLDDLYASKLQEIQTLADSFQIKAFADSNKDKENRIRMQARNEALAESSEIVAALKNQIAYLEGRSGPSVSK